MLNFDRVEGASSRPACTTHIAKDDDSQSMIVACSFLRLFAVSPVVKEKVETSSVVVCLREESGSIALEKIWWSTASVSVLVN